VRRFTLGDEALWYLVLMDESTDRDESWVADYVASYQYKYTWLMLIFPIFGLVAVFSVWRSGAALAVATAAEMLFILVFFEWKTYYVRINRDTISRGSFLHSKTFTLSEIDLVQHIYGSGRSTGSSSLYIRHGNKILLKVFDELDGFDDLVGFFREYAKRHHIIFATRDDWGEWTQAGKSDGGDTI
jgi:hypothetical protein